MSSSWQPIRDLFPALQNYCYLNAAEASPLHKNSFDAACAFYKQMLFHGDIFFEDSISKIELIRENVASLINAYKDEIAFLPNASLAMNFISLILKNQGCVISMKDEFPSSTLPWINNNFDLKLVEPDNYSYPIELIKHYINNNTKIIVSSHVQYKTGFRQNLHSLAQLAINNNCFFIVNATQSFGAFNIDVRNMQIDFLVANTLKWSMAGYGVAILFISRKMQRLFNINPVFGWLSNQNPALMNNNVINKKNSASSLEVGSLCYPPILALGESLDLFKSIGQDNISNRIIDLNLYAIKSINEKYILSPISDTNSLSGILLINVQNPSKVKDILRKQNIIVSIRGNAIRASFHIYNIFQDINTFALAIKPFLQRV